MTAAPEPRLPPRRTQRLREWSILVAVGAAFAAVFIVWTWPLALHPATVTALRAIPEEAPNRLLPRHDQAAVISLVARNAAAILDGDFARLIDQNICHPMPRSATFGEHGIEVGILGLPVYALSRDPILAFNSSILLLIVISGVGMFAWVRYLTGSAAAGFVAGALFAFDPGRLGDLGHPHVIGLHWIPPTLLMFERFLGSGRVGDAALLGTFASLQILVGSYPLMAFAAFATPYGAVRLYQLRGSLDRRRALGLTVAVGFALFVAALVLVPYTVTSSTWKALGSRPALLIQFADLIPGRGHAIALVAILLAIPLAFLRVPRPTVVPAVLAGTALCAALATSGVLWPEGPYLGGFYPWLSGRVPLLGAVRVPAAIGHGIDLGFAVLAGLGMARILIRLDLRSGGRMAALAAVTALVLITVFHPDVSRRIHGSVQRTELVHRLPQPDVLAAYRAFDDADHPGPIVELPFTVARGLVFEMPRYVLMAAYHQRQTAACFKSHLPPTYQNVARIVARLPSNAAIDELVASGFRNVVVFNNVLAKMPDVLTVARQRADIEALYESDTVSSLHLSRQVEVHSDLSQIEVVAGRRQRFGSEGGKSETLDIELANRAASVWVLPRPIEPTIARFRWWKRGIAGPWSERPFLLPIALAAGGRDVIPIEIGATPAGCPCQLEAEIPDLGWRIESAQKVRSRAATAGS